MKLQYEEAMEEYELSYKDLPEDAQTGIDGIKDVLKGIAMLEKRGKNVTPKTMKKLKAMDKWVYFEILDYVQGTDNNEEEMPENPEDLVDEIKEQAQGSNDNKQDTPKVDKKGLEIESELKSMFESGKFEWKIEEVKPVAKQTYNLLFDTYEENGENGVRTSNYALIEKSKQTFHLSKN